MAEQRPGMHLSSTIYCLTRAYWDKTDPEPPTETEVLLFSVGFGLERVLIARHPAEAAIVDGISFTPDFVLMGLAADLKSTRMAPDGKAACLICNQHRASHFNGEVTDHKYQSGHAGFEVPLGWQKQLAGYRYAMNRLNGETRLDYGLAVIHIIQPELKTKQLWWAVQELEDNWQERLERASQLENMISAGTPEPYQWRLYESECANCRYALRCGLQASLDTTAASRALP